MQKLISREDILAMETRFRANFINSLTGFKGLALIGTQNAKGQTNLAIFNSLVHLGAHPPYIAFIVRPDTVERHTLTNILETGFYTINHVNASIYKQAHQTSARYPKEISEFDATGLECEYKGDFFAPFVKASAVQLGVQLKEKINIALNNTILLIGEIRLVFYPEDGLTDDGYIDIEMSGSLCGSGLDGYHSTHRLDRLTYAKPGSLPQTL
jgi:flavin reductase (DIM6/NTAB) family NADH-FMN oxidoreductase RutF